VTVFIIGYVVAVFPAAAKSGSQRTSAIRSACSAEACAT